MHKIKSRRMQLQRQVGISNLQAIMALLIFNLELTLRTCYQELILYIAIWLVYELLIDVAAVL